jgi:FtsP/CotA-like multicopper oxidase with cupredoxin domain
MKRISFALLLPIMILTLAAPATFAQGASTPCSRPEPGSIVNPPPELASEDGILQVSFNFFTGVDDAGRTLFCFRTTAGEESPTLRVHPGDTLAITIKNKIPALPAGAPAETVSNASNKCGNVVMTGTSVNIHFHGMNLSPTCHSDDVLHTLVNSGETFRYVVNIPADEPPGLYWYHPHVHGIAEATVLGGASGAIIVEGLANEQPAVSGLPERLLIVRDQTVAAPAGNDPNVPAWDISLNYIPISYPNYVPSIINAAPGGQEVWRVVNASADTIADLQLRFDGQAQPLQVVGLDGVPTSFAGSTAKEIVAVNHILLPPSGRAEFIVTTPDQSVQKAELVTQKIDTGPLGDFDPERVLAVVKPFASASVLPTVKADQTPSATQRFTGLDTAPVSQHRTLYFSEVVSDPSNPASPTNFFITADGAQPTLFDAVNPPAITTTQGSVEDWTIENRSGENHEFHIHQVHFKLLAVNGSAAPVSQQQMLDTIQVPYWDGKSPYPSVTVRMDFRGPDVGDFVYHCHILGHEDNGMMAIIRVLPGSGG